MKQYEAVIEVMENKGGYATLGELYQEVFNVENVKWGTQTPFASIRRIVQDDRFFFKIKPGLWALKSHKEKVLNLFDISSKKQRNHVNFIHSYYQGLLLEIGRLKKYETFIPLQDKNKKFLQRSLGDLATLKKYFNFTYENILSKAQTIDVTWFNERKMPNSFFEIEHSANFKNSLLKFVELQDFNVNFRIVADIKNEKQYQSVLTMSAFRPISHRVKFMSYDNLADLHIKTIELNLIESKVLL